MKQLHAGDVPGVVVVGVVVVVVVGVVVVVVVVTPSVVGVVADETAHNTMT